MSLPLFEAASSDRARGMAQATAHPEALYGSTWSTLAYAFLVDYAGRFPTFMGWEVVRRSEACSNVPIASGKAWGSIFARAAEAGVIRKIGYEPDPNRHNNPAPRWQSLVCQTDRDSASDTA